VGESTGNAATHTSGDNVSDVLASLEYLKTRPEVAKGKIGLVGHSEGGMIAPMVASQSKDVALIVLLAGVGLPGDQMHRRQVEDMMRLGKAKEEDIQKALALNEKLYAVIKAEKNAPSIHKQLLEVIKQNAPGSETDMVQTTTALAQPWFRYFINFNPIPFLQKVKCPVLALNGSKDVQVASKENLSAIEKAIKQGGNSKVTVKELQGLNHLFQTAETGSLAEYAKIEETFSPIALKVVGDWIEDIVK
jgi:pimeloyl-ACP methyl ester carboxylesterase